MQLDGLQPNILIISDGHYISLEKHSGSQKLVSLQPTWILDFKQSLFSCLCILWLNKYKTHSTNIQAATPQMRADNLLSITQKTQCHMYTKIYNKNIPISLLRTVFRVKRPD